MPQRNSFATVGVGREMGERHKAGGSKKKREGCQRKVRSWKLALGIKLLLTY